MTLFTCMYRWLEEKKKLMVELGEENIELHLDHFITELLPKIRFPMMTPAQLADLLLNPLSQTHTELLVERIRMAMCYHKNQLDISEKGRVSMRCSGIKGTKNHCHCSKSPRILYYNFHRYLLHLTVVSIKKHVPEETRFSLHVYTPLINSVVHFP